jgi:hypothetical protein
MSLIREKISKASEMLKVRNAEGPKNTFPELVAEKRLKYFERQVAQHAAGTIVLVIHLPGAEWSTVHRVQATVQRVRATWRFTFPPVALYKQTGKCGVTIAFIAIACCAVKKFNHRRSFFTALSSRPSF